MKHTTPITHSIPR